MNTINEEYGSVSKKFNHWKYKTAQKTVQCNFTCVHIYVNTDANITIVKNVNKLSTWVLYDIDLSGYMQINAKYFKFCLQPCVIFYKMY